MVTNRYKYKYASKSKIQLNKLESFVQSSFHSHHSHSSSTAGQSSAGIQHRAQSSLFPCLLRWRITQHLFSRSIYSPKVHCPGVKSQEGVLGDSVFYLFWGWEGVTPPWSKRPLLVSSHMMFPAAILQCKCSLPLCLGADCFAYYWCIPIVHGSQGRQGIHNPLCKKNLVINFSWSA